MGLVGVFQLLQLMLHWRVHRMEANLRVNYHSAKDRVASLEA